MGPPVLNPSRQVLPLSDPQRTVALAVWRWTDDLDDPIRVTLDYSLLDQLGWRPGDRIAFEHLPLDRRTGKGGLVLRRANRDEPAIKLRRDHYHRRPNPHAHLLPDGPDGPDVQWPFPVEWLETFFPQAYVPGPGSTIFAPVDRSWRLGEFLDQRGRLVVPLDCTRLMFYLQRTDPDSPTLDVHLPLGVLHLMEWSSSTPLALTSEGGFDPSAADDVLKIGLASPGKANLRWDGAKFVASPSPTWVERYFPGLHGNAKEVPPERPGREPTGPAEGDGDADLLQFPGQSLSDEDLGFDDRKRDTFCVDFSSFRLGPGTLAFAIPATPDLWD